MIDPATHLAPAAAAEGCPTPLAWQEVVRSVVEQSRAIEFRWPGGKIQGLDFGKGPPLVFLPTATGTDRMFALTAWLLRDDYRCLLLGNPLWDKLPALKSIAATTAQHLAEALPTYFGGACHLYACGTGVTTAVHLLKHGPAVVDSAILQGGGGTKLTWAEWLTLNLGRWSRRQMKQTPLWMSVQAQNHRPWFPPFDESRFGFMMNEMGDQAARDVAARILADSAASIHSILPRIEQPVLLLDCEGHGRLIDSQSQHLASHLPHVQREAMHSAGMFPYLTHPHRLVKVLKPFLQSH